MQARSREARERQDKAQARSRAAVDLDKEPWKHPAVWKCHLVRMTTACPDGVFISVAACECGWIVCAKFGYDGHLAQTRAINGHWHCVIAEAEAVPA